MFKLSKKTEYGILALQHMVSKGDGQTATVNDIAQDRGIPRPLLAKILQKLTKKNIIRSVQGSRGGYVVMEDPREITLADVFEAIEGPIKITNCHDQESCCDRYTFCTLKHHLNPLRYQIKSILENITIRDFDEHR